MHKGLKALRFLGHVGNLAKQCLTVLAVLRRLAPHAVCIVAASSPQPHMKSTKVSDDPLSRCAVDVTRSAAEARLNSQHGLGGLHRHGITALQERPEAEPSNFSIQTWEV